MTVRNGSVVGTRQSAHPASLEALQPMIRNRHRRSGLRRIDPAINEVIARFAIDSRCGGASCPGADTPMVEARQLAAATSTRQQTNVVARDVVDRSHVVVSIDVHGDHALLNCIVRC